jgi:hypothetical protein
MKSFLIISICAILLISNCTNINSQLSTNSDKPYFLCNVYIQNAVVPNGLAGMFFQCQCYNDPLLQIISLKLNNVNPDTMMYSPDYQGFTQVTALYRSVSLGAKQLTLLTSAGIATASIVLPDTTYFTSFKDRDTISADSDFTLTWHGNSDFYTFSASIADTNSIQDVDTNIVDSFFTFKSKNISKTAFFIRANISGTTGPFPGSQNGNIVGEGKGFVFSTNSMNNGTNTMLLLFRGRTDPYLSKKRNENADMSFKH